MSNQPDNGLLAVLADKLDTVQDSIHRMDEKLDDHLERLARAEVTIESLRGFIKISVTVFLGVVGFLVTYLFNKLFA